MSDAADIITARILEEPGDLAEVPPAIIREAVRRSMAEAEKVMSLVRESYGDWTAQSDASILSEDISRCLVCAALVIDGDAYDLGWRRDEEGERFCGPCFAHLGEDEGEEPEEQKD